MMGVKKWWDDEGWFGKPDSELRREVRQVCSDLLDVLRSRCMCPLLWLTLELMFSTSAGHAKVRVVQFIFFFFCILTMSQIHRILINSSYYKFLVYDIQYFLFLIAIQPLRNYLLYQYG